MLNLYTHGLKIDRNRLLKCSHPLLSPFMSGLVLLEWCFYFMHNDFQFEVFLISKP